MSRHIPEEDWQIFRKVHPIALKRFSEQILEEIEVIILQESQSAHDKYGQIYKLIKKRDREMGQLFNDYRRSTALIQLGVMNSYGLLKPEEIAEFSEETQKVLNFLNG